MAENTKGIFDKILIALVVIRNKSEHNFDLNEAFIK